MTSSPTDKIGDVIDADRFIACGNSNCGSPDLPSIRRDLSMLLEVYGLRQLVSTATRRTSNVSSLLDVVVANAGTSRITRVTVQPLHHVSNHDLITWSLASKVRPPNSNLSYQESEDGRLDAAHQGHTSIGAIYIACRQCYCFRPLTRQQIDRQPRLPLSAAGVVCKAYFQRASKRLA